MRCPVLLLCAALASGACFAEETNVPAPVSLRELVFAALSNTLADAHASVSNALTMTDMVDDVMSNVVQAVDQVGDATDAAVAESTAMATLVQAQAEVALAQLRLDELHARTFQLAQDVQDRVDILRQRVEAANRESDLGPRLSERAASLRQQLKQLETDIADKQKQFERALKAEIAAAKKVLEAALEAQATAVRQLQSHPAGR